MPESTGWIVFGDVEYPRALLVRRAAVRVPLLGLVEEVVRHGCHAGRGVRCVDDAVLIARGVVRHTLRKALSLLLQERHTYAEDCARVAADGIDMSKLLKDISIRAWSLELGQSIGDVWMWRQDSYLIDKNSASDNPSLYKVHTHGSHFDNRIRSLRQDLSR
jgi:hypothetical protein